MFQHRHGLRFLNQLTLSPTVLYEFGRQKFEGNFSIQNGIFCQIDFAHATFAEETQDLVRTNLFAGDGLFGD